MKKQNSFMRIPILISILVGVAILVGAGYFIGYKKSIKTNTELITPNTDNLNTANSSTLQDDKIVSENDSRDMAVVKAETPQIKEVSVDVCPNIPGSQTSAPVGMVIQNEQCVKPVSQQASMATYTSVKYGLSFKYPENMICDESIMKNNSQEFQAVMIKCGNKNLNGGRSDEAGGKIQLIVDNGSSTNRTTFRERSTESKTIIVGNNKFYGSTFSAMLERPNYLVAVLNLLTLVPPSHLDLNSLTFN